MAQFGYPTSDITLGSWTHSTGSTHFGVIDEVSYDDADYIQLTNSTSNACEVQLNTLTDPTSSANHIVHLRVQKQGTGTITLDVALVQNTTVIRTQSITLTASWADASFTLTAGEADSISDYTNLRIRCTGVANSATRYVRVSWANLEVPNVAQNAVSHVDGYLKPNAIATPNQKPAYTKGKATATPDHKDGYLNGATASFSANDHKDAYLKPTATYLEQKPGYLKGQAFALEHRDGFLKAQATYTGQKPAYLSAIIKVQDHKDAYLQGNTSEVETSDTQSAFMLGLDQLLVPNSLIAGTVGVWQNQLGGTTNIYTSIDESFPPSDTDYIWDIDPATGDHIEFGLSAPAGTPAAGDIVILFRARDKSNSGNVSGRVNLYCDTALVAQSAAFTLTSTPTIYYYMLTPAERADITNWSGLSIRIVPAVS